VSTLGDAVGVPDSDILIAPQTRKSPLANDTWYISRTQALTDLDVRVPARELAEQYVRPHFEVPKSTLNSCEREQDEPHDTQMHWVMREKHDRDVGFRA
jgi:hypothetical protein